jgi:ATP-dependent DNA helicase DinG
LYVAAHLPARGASGSLAPEVLDEIVGLVEAAGGRTLGLFSSRWAAQAAADAVRDRIGVPLLTQWDAPLPQLVDKFAAEPRTCLFGTLSLWQGVDVPGTSCTLVLIDKIPFPRPDDPLVAARQKAADDAGRNGFMSVSVPRAALLLAQGVGRLIRSDADRGVVAVLDPRLRTARYGDYLVRSLPPFWSTTDPERVRASLRTLDDAATVLDAAAGR